MFTSIERESEESKVFCEWFQSLLQVWFPRLGLDGTLHTCCTPCSTPSPQTLFGVHGAPWSHHPGFSPSSRGSSPNLAPGDSCSADESHTPTSSPEPSSLFRILSHGAIRAGHWCSVLVWPRSLPSQLTAHHLLPRSGPLLRQWTPHPFALWGVPLSPPAAPDLLPGIM